MVNAQQQQVLPYDRVAGLKYGVAPFPLPPNGKRVNFAAGPNLALFGGTKQPEGAWEIVEYLSESGRLTAFNVAGGSMPPRRSAAQSKDYLALHPTMKFFADESCGQCTPCRVGTEKALTLMNGRRWDKPLLAELSQAMMDASICGLGQAAPNPVLSVFKYFPAEVD